MTSRRLQPAGMILFLVAAASQAHASDETLLRAREGTAALLRGQYEKAVAAYDNALSNAEIADFVKASIHSDRGVAKWRLKQTKEALDDFNLSLQISPENVTVYNNRGNALIELGRLGEAVKDFDRAIALSPNYGAAYNNRGNAHAALGQYEPAFHDYRKAVALMPRSAVPLNGRGKAHAALKRYHAALRDFTKAISINAEYEPAYRNCGEAYLALVEFNKAADDFTQALNLRPDEPELLLLRARAYSGDKKYDAALVDLKKVIELKPDLVDAYIERGQLFTDINRVDDAIAELSHALALSPQNARAYSMRALAKLQAAPPVPKEQRTPVVPKSPAEHTSEASHGGDRKPGGGAAAAADAVVEPANDPSAAAPMGDAAETVSAAEPQEVARNQAISAALSDAQQALAVASDDAFALRVRGDMYQAMGRTDEAIADYRQALERDPFQSESREALVKLDQEVPTEQGLPLGAPVSNWVIKEPAANRFIASNSNYPKIRVELEMFGAGKPEIIEWRLMKDALTGIGLLRYDAGDLGEEGGQGLVYAAIVDLHANRVVATEPFSWGASAANWNWQAATVVVTDPDGNTNEIKLRKAGTRSVAREASGSSRWRAPSSRRRGGGGVGSGGFFDSFFR